MQIGLSLPNTVFQFPFSPSSHPHVRQIRSLRSSRGNLVYFSSASFLLLVFYSSFSHRIFYFLLQRFLFFASSLSASVSLLFSGGTFRFFQKFFSLAPAFPVIRILSFGSVFFRTLLRFYHSPFQLASNRVKSEKNRKKIVQILVNIKQRC